ncbi:MAG: cobalt transporter CbiM [Oscillospiraceae bacterium]|jgi:cobalt/nickel transport system permease protein|nr:cobalt transporter CbiM [Oscillospiraceae bacterium]
MHIPENYLSPATCAVMAVAAVPVIAVAVKNVKREVTRAKLPMLGVGAAFSFLLMMFNLPLPGGTTGHAVGGTLIAILLGPWSAVLSVGTALAIQALLFGDGGILSLGANIFNIAFILPFVGYFVFKLIRGNGKSKTRETVGIAVGSWVGLNAAALFTAIEFGIQPLIAKGADGLPLYCPYPLSVAIPAMMIPHMLVAGVAEALFTVLIITYIKKVSPGDIYEGQVKRSKGVYALVLALIAAVPLGLLAAGTAWGEWGADEIGEIAGFVPAGLSGGFEFSAIMPDYSIAGLPEVAGYILSAVFGAAIVIVVFRLIAGFVKEKKA